MKTERILCFPLDANRGRLYLQPQASNGQSWDASPWPRHRSVVTDVCGAVVIPGHDEQHITLTINSRGAADLSFLTELEPDSITALEVRHTLLDRPQMEYLAHLSGLRQLDIHHCLITAEGLAQLPRLAHLQRLWLGMIESHADAVLAPLAALEHLEWLDINLTYMSGVGLACLRALPRLAWLRLTSGDAMTTAGWAEVGRLRQVRCLDLAAVPTLTDDMMLHVGQLENLEELNVGHTPIEGSGFVYLAHLPRLRTLDVSGSALRSENLIHLRRLPALEDVGLLFVSVSADGLAHLARIASLKRLSLYEALASSDGLDRLAEVTALEELDLTGCTLDNQGLAAIGWLTKLQALQLSGASGITDRGIESLRNLVDLRELSIGPADVGDRGLAVLARMTRLETLWLGAPHMTAAGLEHLASLGDLQRLSLGYAGASTALQRLRSLSRLAFLWLRGMQTVRARDLAFLSDLACLRYVEIADSDLEEGAVAAIAALPTVRHVSLPNTHLTDASMHTLSRMRALILLDVSNNPITTAGVRACLPLQELEELDLEATQVDDSVVADLASFPKLDRVTLWQTQMSAGGRTQLKESLPNCEVYA